MELLIKIFMKLRIKIFRNITLIAMGLGLISAASGLSMGCKSSTPKSSASETPSESIREDIVPFDADSAYSYVARQVAFGPRVNNTPAHRACGRWLAAELKRHGAEVTLQPARLKAFDGQTLEAVNILGQYNPAMPRRTLLVAHWDTRPWADADPDPANHSKPVDGANDGGSGVGVLLEIARQFSINPPKGGVDILFVDAEDHGSMGDEDSWALGASYFVAHPPVKDYLPSRVILLDMVGGENARFHREYFSQANAPELTSQLWNEAKNLGLTDIFPDEIGGAVNDDHLKFQEAGIPAIDIIEYNPRSRGFNERWHTVSDNMEGISRQTLENVGKVVLSWLRHQE